jgi:hypothetical protein
MGGRGQRAKRIAAAVSQYTHRSHHQRGREGTANAIFRSGREFLTFGTVSTSAFRRSGSRRKLSRLEAPSDRTRPDTLGTYPW